MNTITPSTSALPLQSELGYQFKNVDLLAAALTHKSAHFEAKEKFPQHNEKLEFLGDAVLDLILSDVLMREFPQDDEGHLSKKRASLVNEAILAKIAMDLNLSQYLLMGKGELVSGGEKKPRLLASALEALMGALFLDGGFEPAHKVAYRLFAPLIGSLDPGQDFIADFKTRFQEVVQSEFKSAPLYKLTNETGPSHDREFEVEVRFRDQVFGKGKGRSKKAAEQEAAREALQQWMQKKGDDQ